MIQTAEQVLFPRAGQVEVREVPVPHPGPGELRLRITRAGICATDLHLRDGHIGDPFPLVPGHEFIGVIDEVGPADVRGLALGESVAVEMLVPCQRCDRCREGRYNLCQQDLDTPGPGRQLGVNIPDDAVPYAGGYASHLIVPAQAIVHRIPETVDPDAAVLVEPLAVACRAVSRGRVRSGESVVIIGPGPVGLLCAAAASAAGAAAVVVVGGRAERRTLSRSFGSTAQLDGRGEDLVSDVHRILPGGADVVIESAGSVDAQRTALMLVRRGGRVVLAGACGAGPTLQIPSDELLLTREIDLLPSFLSAGGFEPALALLASGRFPFTSLVTHVYPLADVARAFADIENRTEGLIKAVLVPEERS
ncbi:zinc-dependent alcohol dehydrogenase [Microbacterium gorillae]|uniref:zinc-dependent alcohol dehydrogenase n=1 Tax=Microbacterium gorillae TaxID=1231063 RepID=UPI0005900010|nr:alcohol dehydrogenase catalytic domain-containing protein [Microbacterium gorillae]